ncbi:MAG: efflux RND transporter periplasmic adaptor subunit [Limnochordia bacterium]|nr:efflux RND transporter periplasmic adaptor subunit [Limnochordia bacterium]MDD2629401.1 efflux RND transporter periplasmic adaptor subunit [Limnochordia bacterium]MDD4516972.1 efflux RND transporter periplasmic adaptor subunit [Limnochordia bacterium]
MEEKIIVSRPKKRRKNSQLGLLLFVVAFLVAIVVGTYYFFKPKEEDFLLEYYSYAVVETRDFTETFSVVGSLQPRKVKEIHTLAEGVIGQILVQEGQDVFAGEPILVMESARLLKQRDEGLRKLNQMEFELATAQYDAEADLLLAEQALRDGEQKVIDAQEKIDLLQQLFQYGTISEKEVQDAQKALGEAQRNLEQATKQLEVKTRRAEASIDNAEVNVKIAETELEQIERAIEGLMVYAPIDGRILGLEVSLNQEVPANKIIGRIADVTDQIVEIKVTSTQADRLSEGQTCSIAVGSALLSGHITYIAPSADTKGESPTVVVRVEIDGSAEELRPGSSAIVDIHVRNHPNSLCLPRGPYLVSGQRMFVYVLQGDKALRKDVRLGIMEGNYVQVLEGIEAGEKVITSSYDEYRQYEEILVNPEGGRMQ